MKVINKFLTEGTLNPKPSAKGLVKVGNYYLILRIREESNGAGHWDLPGGGIEEGENKEDALKREIFEETNLTVSNIKSAGTGKISIPENGIEVDINYFECESDNNEVILKPAKWDKPDYIGTTMWSGSGSRPEHVEYKWIQYKTELENLPMLKEFKDTLMKKLK